MPRSRPELHLTPSRGILDAPAGVLEEGGTWHLFYQYQPQADGVSRWAHEIGMEAPFYWEACDDVLAPQGNQTTLRAGSVVPGAAGQALLFYTEVADGTAHVAVASCELADPLSETEGDLDPSVQVLGRVLEGVRSPCVLPHLYKEGWLLLGVQGPDLVIAESTDATSWRLLGPLRINGESGIAEDAKVAAPRIIRLRDLVEGNLFDVLIVTIESRSGVDISGYMVGRLNGSTFTVSAPFRRIDFGHDFTRPRNTNKVHLDVTYRSATLFGLMNGVGKLDDAHRHHSFHTEGWANCLSLPRRVTLESGILYQTPMPGIVQAVEESDEAVMWTMRGVIPAGEQITVTLTVAGEPIGVVTHRAESVQFDRSMNPHHSDDTPAIAPVHAPEQDHSLTIIVDGSAVEIFAAGGQVAMSSRVYSPAGPVTFEVNCTPGAAVESETTIARTG